MRVISNICVNSKWIAAFMAEDGQECCECGRCKLRVMHGNRDYEYIMTEDEINIAKLQSELEAVKAERDERDGVIERYNELLKDVVVKLSVIRGTDKEIEHQDNLIAEMRRTIHECELKTQALKGKE